jgi:hypothetical protein
VLEPEVVDAGDTIPRAEDDIHEITALMGFAEPVREAHLGAVATERKRLERAVEVLAHDEQIEILRVADDARIVQESVRATHQERHSGVTEDMQRAPVEGVRTVRRLVERRLIGHAAGQRLASVRA